MHTPRPTARPIVSGGHVDPAYLARLEALEEAQDAAQALDRAHWYLDRARRRHAVAQAHLAAANSAWIASEKGGRP